MDKVFQEELNNLSGIQQRIDSMASHYEKNAKTLKAEIDDFYCVDYEDRAVLKDLRDRHLAAKEYAESYRQMQLSPYFGRLDLDAESGDDIITSTYFIGKQGISDGSNVLVIDWRTPLGSCYYASNQRKFHVRGQEFMLALRRALDIRDGKLVGYKTEYDGETVSLEGDVIDPFLLTVLKDKRRHNRLTDIIRTIQGNQNEIIRKPKEESFVVQGCAGSGKTMILLHRLSYLKFNNRNISFAGTKIITPNRFFDAHINDLSAELGLNAIQRMSVEEYYVSLIKRFSSKVDADAVVISEKILNEHLLEELYSVDYLNRSITDYHDYWNKVLAAIDESRLRSLFSRFKIVYPDTAKHKADAATALEYGISSIANSHQAYVKKVKALSERLENANQEILAVQTDLEDSDGRLRSITEQTILRLQKELDDCTKSIQSGKTQREGIEAKRKDALQKKSQSQSTLEQLNHMLDLLAKNNAAYVDFDQFSQLDDIITAQIRGACQQILDAISENEDILSKTPVYNFGKRSRIRREITAAKEQFAIHAQSHIQSMTQDIQAQSEKLSSDKDQASKECDRLLASIHAIDKSIQADKNRAVALTECFGIFQNISTPDLSVTLSTNASKECSVIVSSYKERWSSHRKLSKRHESLVALRNSILEDLQSSEYSRISDEDAAYVASCTQLVKKLHFNEVSRSIMYRELFATYKRHGQDYHKSNYRHRLYLKLLYCALYFSPSAAMDTFLNIDEAQDLSVAEYKLLRLILGNRCVFNLYGDINQLVYSYKGIVDWDDLSDIIGSNVYVLNENYRNTLQITNFCNAEFDADVYPIGIAGEPVEEMSTADAVSWIIKKKEQYPEYRAAIIYRYGIKSIQDALNEILPADQVSWFEVNDRKISVLSVETAKGLEFEVVVAIVDQMLDNEKYISYTRALDSLVVVRDPYSSEFITDNSEIVDSLDAEALPLEDVNAAQGNDEHDLPPVKATEEIVPPPLDENIASTSTTSSSSTAVSMSDDDYLFLKNCNSQLEEKFGSDHALTAEQQKVIIDLRHRLNVACDAPSGWMKSVMLYLVAQHEHSKTGKQTILTAEAHLQENELVLAEKMGLLCGSIDGGISDFDKDFKKAKYDVIFVPYRLFSEQQNISEFVSYFDGKIAYWGLDHPILAKESWTQLCDAGDALGATMYLMSKEGFDGLSLTGYMLHISKGSSDHPLSKVTLFSEEDKVKWLIDNAGLLHGQGLIYCNDEAICKTISKQLRKKKIKAEAYVDVFDSSNKERVNYLTNSFSNGGLPVLVTTHSVGKNLTNPNIRFIVHYDVPEDRELYQLHLSQIGQLADNPMISDLCCI